MNTALITFILFCSLFLSWGIGLWMGWDARRESVKVTCIESCEKISRARLMSVCVEPKTLTIKCEEAKEE